MDGNTTGQRFSAGDDRSMGLAPLVPWLPDIARRLLACALLSLVGSGLVLGGFLLVRRLTGAIDQPVSAPGMIALAVSLLIVLVLVRLANREVVWPDARIAVAVPLMTVLGAAMILASLTFPSSINGALAPAWTTLIVAELLMWRISKAGPPHAPAAGRVSEDRVSEDRAFPEGQAAPAGCNPGDALHRVLEDGSDLVNEEEEEMESESVELPPQVSRQLTRCKDEDGADTLCGMLREAFAAGERTRDIHLVFCPAFTSIPSVSVDQVDGPETRIKVAEVQSYGARLEARLTAPPSHPSDVVIEVYVRCEMTLDPRRDDLHE